jgi:hypothetical protein
VSAFFHVITTLDTLPNKEIKDKQMSHWLLLDMGGMFFIEGLNFPNCE